MRAMLLLGMSALLSADAEPAGAPCAALGVSVEVYSSSRLVSVTEERLELTRGRRLACESPRVTPVVLALERALQPFPRQRLSKPVRVHLDPSLPRGHAPIWGIEVHVTSREILVSEADVARLQPAAWQHELFHTLASEPALASPLTRRLWLTLEEALVLHLTAAGGHAEPEETAASPAWPGAAEANWEQLLMSGYDPHPLAELLALELARAEPRLESAAALRCLTAPPPETRHPETLSDGVRRFVSRCPMGAAEALRSAVVRWLPEPLSPWSQQINGNTAAFAAESR